jgi:hypothetical protein
LNSLLDSDIEIEGGYLGSNDFYDPFSFSKQKILEDILKETERRIEKTRPLS